MKHKVTGKKNRVRNKVEKNMQFIEEKLMVWVLARLV